MRLRLTRVVHPGAVLAYADPDRALAFLRPGCLPESEHVRAVRRLGCRVLEYGCGSGGVTLALARAGIEVTGVDLSQKMLAHLACALGRESPAVRARVRVHHGDMRDLILRERFPVVLVADGTFQHLYQHDDVRAFLARVRHHLVPGGRLRLDVELPDLRALGTPERWMRYYPLTQVVTRSLDGDPSLLLAQRQYFPAELRGLLERAGARIRTMRVATARQENEGGAGRTRHPRLVLHCEWDKPPHARGEERQTRSDRAGFSPGLR
ncbi:MAG: class I SAM-dependent methyltransferase [Polyangiaceae bacterium]|nr:class I SAM-dependent methyltransferase [Polyangiaceae bacterium]